MSTIKEIALKAGVSMMTVSRALNTPEKVKDEVRDRILTIANELRYSPNLAARALVTRRTGIIQIVVKSTIQSSDPYFMRLFVGIADYLSEYNYSIQITRQFDHQNQSDGVIAMGLKAGEDQELYDKALVPAVIFGKTELPIDWVDIDNQKAIQTAVHFLVSQGHTHIGFLALDINEHYAKERLIGYQEAMLKENLIVKDTWINFVADGKEAGKEGATKLLQDHQLTAIVCSTDLLAIGVLEAAIVLEKKIPEALEVIGMDGIYLDKIASPNLTTVQQPVYEIGRTLAQCILNRINNLEGEIQRKLIDTQLIIQGTTK